MALKIWVAGEKVTADDLNGNFDIIDGAPANIRVYNATSNSGASNTQFDITNPAGSTFRYTYDGTGTDPGISAASVPVGTIVQIYSPNFNSNNNGVFTVTGSGANYFEVTNASGVAESNKTIGSTGFLNITDQTWTKPTGLVKVIVEVIGGGGGGGGVNAGVGNTGSSGGGGAGGYSKKIISAASLNATEHIAVGCAGVGGSSSPTDGGPGGWSAFGSHLSASGGAQGGVGSGIAGGSGGVGSSGDINSKGMGGMGGSATVAGGGQSASGSGGSSHLGGGGASATSGSNAGGNYGGGGSGGASAGGSSNGGNGAPGIVIVTEYVK